jgi:hypothetical protein
MLLRRPEAVSLDDMVVLEENRCAIPRSVGCERGLSPEKQLKLCEDGYILVVYKLGISIVLFRQHIEAS